MYLQCGPSEDAVSFVVPLLDEDFDAHNEQEDTIPVWNVSETAD